MRGGAPLVQQGFATYGSDSGHQAGGPGAPDPSADEWALNDEAVANLGYMQLKKTHDAAMVLMRAGLRRAAALQLLLRDFPGRPRGADRGAALPRRLRRHLRRGADRQLLVADARAGTDPHPGEAAGQLGDAGQGERHPRRVHATVRQARRPRGRRDQQLHGVPRDLRREAGRAEPRPLGRQALSQQRGPESAGYQRRGLPDGWPDRHAQDGVLPVRVRDAAGQRREVLRHVVSEHGSVGQRADRATRVTAARKARPKTRRCTATWAFWA